MVKWLLNTSVLTCPCVHADIVGLLEWSDYWLSGNYVCTLSWSHTAARIHYLTMHSLGTLLRTLLKTLWGNNNASAQNMEMILHTRPARQSNIQIHIKLLKVNVVSAHFFMYWLPVRVSLHAYEILQKSIKYIQDILIYLA